MIKEYSVDFNKQQTFCQIRGKGSMMRQWIDTDGNRIDIDTMVACFLGDIAKYEQHIDKITPDNFYLYGSNLELNME